MSKNNFKHKSWLPTKPISRGASSYHDAVVTTSWHIENINGLIDLIHKEIKDGEIIVDFGAGTGASTIYFFKQLKAKNIKIWLVDNSPSWLGKAYEVLKGFKNVDFFLLEKMANRYETLDEVVGNKVVNHVLSANTVHLIPDIEGTFKGIYKALKPGGTFTFQSGNIKRKERKEGILMIDDTVKRVHDIALAIIQTDSRFKKYRKDLNRRIELNISQRKLVFPDPRPIEYYRDMLKFAGFKNIKVTFKPIKVAYDDWLNFLRVRRLQAGILPEVGGKDATSIVEEERDKIITQAANDLFNDLKKQNRFADNTSFTAEWTYLTSRR